MEKAKTRRIGGLYDTARVLLFGIPKPVGVSIDITNRCNLRCVHCYFLRGNYDSELNDEEWIDRIKMLKREYKTLLQASWCGGEPLLRKELAERGMKMFRYNLVVTNGTLPLPNWQNCLFEVSVDGTRELHDKIRGNGTYNRIKENISQREDLRINLACMLSRLNYQSVEAIVKEWSETSVRGVYFGFYSQTKTEPVSDLRMEPKLRDETIGVIKSLKKDYGKFILPTDRMLDLMRSQNRSKVTSNCLFNDLIVSLGPDGVRKKCPVGEEADCAECGHSPPFFMKSLEMRDFETIKFLLRETVAVGF